MRTVCYSHDVIHDTSEYNVDNPLFGGRVETSARLIDGIVTEST